MIEDSRFENKNIQEFEYEETIVSDGNVIGSCELGKATIKLLNSSNEYSVYKDSWIKTIHGSFYIYDVQPVQEKVSIQLDCYDIKYKLDSKYDSSLYSFPMTLKEWRNAIFNTCGVEYDDSDFPNSNLVLNRQPYVETGASNRNVISMIAAAGMSFVVTVKDIFYFSWFSDTTFEVEDWSELTTEKNNSNPIDGIILGRGDVGDDVSYPEEIKINSGIRIDNNCILDPQDIETEYDQRKDVIIPLYERVKDFSYLIFNMRTQFIDNKLNLLLGQKIKYLDSYDNSLSAYVMTKTIVYLSGDESDSNNYEIVLSAEKINETSKDFSYKKSINETISEVSRKADKINGSIMDLVSVVDEQGNKLESVISQVGGCVTITVYEEKQAATDKKIDDTGKEIQILREELSAQFTTKGLQTGKTGDDINSTLDNHGLKIYNISKLIAIFNKNGSGINKLIVTNSIQFQNLLLKKGEKETKRHGTIPVIQGFWLENLIETLENLEV